MWALLGFACVQETRLDEIAASYVVSPDLVDLGVVPVGAEAPLSFGLVHTGGGALRVAAVELDAVEGGGFAFTGAAPVDVAPGGAVDLPFVFAPTQPGWSFAAITLVTNGAEPEVVVSARAHAVTGWAAVRPGRIDLGPIPAGGVATAPFEVTNLGDAPVLVLGVEADPPFEAQLAPVTLAPGASASGLVQVGATSTAALSGALRIVVDGDVATGVGALAANDCAHGAPDRYDVDHDGVTSCGGDCDDADPARRPGATEREDGADDDCDGVIDDGTSGADDDGDGFSERAGDCVDADAAIGPAAAEDPTNGIDDDCDGTVDAGATDKDHDGFAPGGGDCDDTDGDVHPGADEIANGVDDDCDGTTDEGTRRSDDDGDGVTENGGDCDDTSATAYPGAAEVANGADDDCDGAIDEGTSAADDDGDGFTEDGGDCDDADASESPAALDVAGGDDDDCDGTP